MRIHLVIVALTASSLFACSADPEVDVVDPAPTQVSEISSTETSSTEISLEEGRNQRTAAQRERSLTPAEREAAEHLERTVLAARFQESK